MHNKQFDKGTNVLCKDTIDRQLAIDAFKPYAEYESNRSNKDWVKRIEVILSGLPPAQPEIIRCKDCKIYDDRPCGRVEWYNTADDFCSKAERKEQK